MRTPPINWVRKRGLKVVDCRPITAARDAKRKAKGNRPLVTIGADVASAIDRLNRIWEKEIQGLVEIERRWARRIMCDVSGWLGRRQRPLHPSVSWSIA